jgi:hypothetical protein
MRRTAPRKRQATHLERRLFQDGLVTQHVTYALRGEKTKCVWIVRTGPARRRSFSALEQPQRPGSDFAKLHSHAESTAKSRVYLESAIRHWVLSTYRPHRIKTLKWPGLFRTKAISPPWTPSALKRRIIWNGHNRGTESALSDESR